MQRPARGLPHDAVDGEVMVAAVDVVLPVDGERLVEEGRGQDLFDALRILGIRGHERTLEHHPAVIGGVGGEPRDIHLELLSDDVEGELVVLELLLDIAQPLGLERDPVGAARFQVLAGDEHDLAGAGEGHTAVDGRVDVEHRGGILADHFLVDHRVHKPDPDVGFFGDEPRGVGAEIGLPLLVLGGVGSGRCFPEVAPGQGGQEHGKDNSSKALRKVTGHRGFPLVIEPSPVSAAAHRRQDSRFVLGSTVGYVQAMKRGRLLIVPHCFDYLPRPPLGPVKIIIDIARGPTTGRASPSSDLASALPPKIVQQARSAPDHIGGLRVPRCGRSGTRMRQS